ncbi:MAG: NAD-dependent epimerase/dehydratase family protein [Dehalococcoidia bacterium]
MRVLVTGAAGFLGQHICSLLDTSGHEVIGTDLIQNQWVKSPFDVDITVPERFLFNPASLDAVIHLAAIAAPRECDADPARAFNVNVNGTHQVLKLALEAGVKKFVFVSSAHVYGISPRYLPTDERHPLALHDTYTTTKILGEQLCELYYQNHGLSYTTLRLYNAYGPGQRRGYFIPDMIYKARNGGIGELAGATTKDFVYVEDVARGCVSALETPFVGPINIGTGRQCTLFHVAGLIADKVGVPKAEAVSSSATKMQSDSTRAKRVLDWEPTVRIEEGLDATIADASFQPLRYR